MTEVTYPNFLHVGTAKAASSWTWRVFQEHPEIYVPANSDNPNFFTVHYHRGMDWYLKTYFDKVENESAVGEFSNSYMVFEPAIQRIARDLPDVRLFMILRNPIERFYLQWTHFHLKPKLTLGKYGMKPDMDPENGKGIPMEFALHQNGHNFFRWFVEPGMYAHQIDNIYRFFDRSRVLITIYDDLAEDNQGFLETLYSFLGVSTEFRSSLCGQDVNPDVKSDRQFMSDELRTELVDVYADDISKLEDLLHRDLSHWRS